ncbi:MAG: carbohydrate kinase [Acidobacteria bacterium]|nr:carbohydrate kinase [Acidobacteriota bacterium]
MAWIAIDAGTSVIKSVAFTSDGRELALARAKTKVRHVQPNFSEQNMEEVWQAVVETVRDVAVRCGEAIEGLVTTAQGDGCWLVDREGNPVRDAVLWNDGRAYAVVERWRTEGVVDRAFCLSGSVAYAGLSSAIASWLSENEAETMDRAAWILSCNGWIFSRMTRRFLSDRSDGSNPYSDVEKGEYSTELLRLYGREPDAKLLPEIASGKKLSAPLDEAAARQMGLTAGIPAIMAPYDIVSTAYGCGVGSAGQACVILGTTLCPEVVTDRIDLNETPAGTTIALGGGRFLRAMPTLTGCEALEWAARMLGCDGLHGLEELAARSEAAGAATYFLPYLSPAGERAPFLAPEASGSFHGITLATTREEIALSVYEGLSFVIHECLEESASYLSEMRVTGGGARSDLWCQLIADVTGLRVLRPEGSEQGAQGAFLFAQAVEQGESIESVLQRMPISTVVFSPREARLSVLRRRYEIWKSLRAVVAPEWSALRGER